MLGEPRRGRLPHRLRRGGRSRARVARAAADGADWRTALALGVPALAGGLAHVRCCSPRAATDRFVGDRVLADARSLRGGAGAARPAPAHALWAGGLLYLAVLVAAFVVPTPFGQNALRLGAARPGRCSCSRSRTARARRCSRSPSSASACSTCSGCRPCARWPRRTATRRRRPPSRPRRATSSTAHAKPGERRRGAADAQPLGGGLPRARSSRSRAAGSASSTRRPTRSSTTSSRSPPPRYHALAARQRRALGRAAERAARLLRARRRRALLRAARRSSSSVHASPRWRIWEVRGTEPPASGRRAADWPRAPNGFEVEATRPGACRAPALHAVLDRRRRDGCVIRARGRLDARRRAARRAVRCARASGARRAAPRSRAAATAPGAPPASSVSRPVGGR